MTAHTAEMSADLLCDRCGYDLRAHAHDAKCPECGAAVSESRRLAESPRRPAWRDSDPRWRRRMLAGAWILVLLPLMDVLQMRSDRPSACIPVPNRSTVTLPCTAYARRYFCLPPAGIGCVSVAGLLHRRGAAVLERAGTAPQPPGLDASLGRHMQLRCVARARNVAYVVYIAALVLTGIAAIFLYMPPKYQPPVTHLFIEVSTAYLRYGPHPTNITALVLVAFSSIAILLACVPLFDAMRSSGSKWAAAILLAPLALFSLIHLEQAATYCLYLSGLTSADVFYYLVYFRPQVLEGIAGLWSVPRASGFEIFVEATKWCVILAIAIWLSIAQLAAWRQGKKTRTATSSSTGSCV